MINYYRASVRQSQKEAAAKLRPISAPTLVIWGERDSYLGSDLAEPDRDDVPNLDRVERLPDASHWAADSSPMRPWASASLSTLKAW
jgi:epoxide hydrolase 4